jgi:hypothetical protein
MFSFYIIVIIEQEREINNRRKFPMSELIMYSSAAQFFILLLLLLLWLYSPFLGLSCFLSFFILHKVGGTPWMGNNPSQGRYLHSGQHKH